MAVEGHIIVDGIVDPDPNLIGADFYAVFDGAEMIEATAENLGDLSDIAAFIPEIEDARSIEARLQLANPGANIGILLVTRSTVLPTGKAAAIRP